MKNFLLNTWYWFEINVIIGFAHILAFIALAFNDTGEHYDTVIEAIPYIRNGLGILVVASIFAGLISKNRNKFNMIQYIIMQSVLVILWVMFYISNLVG